GADEDVGPPGARLLDRDLLGHRRRVRHDRPRAGQLRRVDERVQGRGAHQGGVRRSPGRRPGGADRRAPDLRLLDHPRLVVLRREGGRVPLRRGRHHALSRPLGGGGHGRLGRVAPRRLVLRRHRQRAHGDPEPLLAHRALRGDRGGDARTPLGSGVGVNPPFGTSTHLLSAVAMPDDEKAELERVKAENERLRRTASRGITFKVSEKGGVSVYGLGRFPVTLYKEQWEELEVNVFRGRSPQENRQRVFGGQVAGQALVAAGRTVDRGNVHSLHAYFLRPGDPSTPILYLVDRIRDGKTFTTRRVVAIQHG